MKVIHTLWDKPFNFGPRRSCKGCNGLILRKPQPHGKLKYCTDDCKDRYERKLRYNRYKDKEQLRVRQWKQTHAERVKQTNDYWNNKRKEKKQFNYYYLESLIKQ